MKSGWTIKSLGEVCDIVGGGTPAKSNASFYKGHIPWATVRDMQCEKITKTEFQISKEAIKNSSTNVIPANNVVIATRVGLGKVCLLAQDTAINQDLRGVVPRTNAVDVHYLFRWLQSISGVIESAGTGATVKGVKLPFIKSLKIPIPPLLDQRRIVTILDEAVAGIETAIANTERNLTNSRELFESHLNAVFSHKGGGWRDFTLKEACEDYGRGKSKHRPRNDPKLFGGKYPFIQTGDVRHSDHLITSYSSTYNELGLAQSKLWPKGTICITIAANIAETGILGFDACFPDSIIGLVVDERRASNAYVEFLLQSVKAVLKAKGKGSAQDNINLGTFEKEKFPFPPLSIQNQIVEDAQELRGAVSKLESIYKQKFDVLTELKQSLLQKAFSGELTADAVDEAKKAVA